MASGKSQSTMRLVRVGAPPPEGSGTSTPGRGGSKDCIVEDPDQDASLLQVARAVARARKVVVVCGAGISTSADIPDFRSTTGLFATLKAKHPKARLSSGKDLFTASLYQNEDSTALFYAMIAELKTMSDAAEPTAFHRLLKQLDESGKLFRVYTQNIDGLEEKVGLSYGLDELDTAPASPTKKRKRASDGPSGLVSLEGSSSAAVPSQQSSVASESEATLLPPSSAPLSMPPTSPAAPVAPGLVRSDTGSTLADVARDPMTTPTKPKTPRASSTAQRKKRIAAADAPRVIPLHGSMQTLTCTKCAHREPLADHVETLRRGQAVGCRVCVSDELERRRASERSRGVGVMKVGVVLYGEEHQHASRVGEITQKDLFGPRPDLLIVAGTSLKVPGTKRLVRELAKVSRPAEPKDDGVHAIFLNYDLPAPATAWRDTFDVIVQGDIEAFVAAVQPEIAAVQSASDVRAQKASSRKTKRSSNFFATDHAAESPAPSPSKPVLQRELTPSPPEKVEERAPPVLAPVAPAAPKRTTSGPTLGASRVRGKQDLNKPFRSVVPKPSRPNLSQPPAPSPKRAAKTHVVVTEQDYAAYVAKPPEALFAGRTRSQSRDGSSLADGQLSPTRASFARPADEHYSLAPTKPAVKAITSFMPATKRGSTSAGLKK